MQELRETYEKQLGDNRDEFTRMYDDKLRGLRAKLEQERIDRSGGVQERRELETRVAGLTSRNLELESLNTSLSKRVEDLIREMEEAAKNYRNDMAKKVRPTR